jgi:hypothetical protein
LVRGIDPMGHNELLVDRVDLVRVDADRRGELGQFMTPVPRPRWRRIRTMPPTIGHFL